MNFKLVRQKVMVSSVVGILSFIGSGIVSEATDVEEHPMYTESEEQFADVEPEEQFADVEPEEKIYGEYSFGLVEDYTYIYEEKSDSSSWVGKLYENNKVEIISYDDTWAEIQSGTVIGYVELVYLLEEEASIIKALEIGTDWAIVQATALNVRVGPGMEYEIVGTVPFETELLIAGTEVDGWQMVQYNNELYYVSSEYIIEETQYSYAESQEDEIARIAEYNTTLAQQESETTESGSVNSEDVIDTSATVGNTDGASVVEFALQFIGNPYVWGGTDLVNGADCSGFVQSVYATFGISLPRTSSSQRSAGVEVSYDEIQLGDIICYDGHVGIYIGNDQIVNAIGSAYGIGISSATYKSIITIRRVI